MELKRKESQNEERRGRGSVFENGEQQQEEEEEDEKEEDQAVDMSRSEGDGTPLLFSFKPCSRQDIGCWWENSEMKCANQFRTKSQ